MNQPTVARVEPEARAAVRDASYCNKPRLGIPLRYHVVLGDIKSNQGACGGFVVATSGDFDTRDLTVAASGVRPGLRCAKPGCRVRWPAYEAER